MSLIDSARMNGFLDIIKWMDDAPKDYKVTVSYKESRRAKIMKQGALLAGLKKHHEFYATRDNLNFEDAKVFCSAWDAAYKD